MDKRIGVYVCSGCSIGESLDVQAVGRVAQAEYKASLVRIHSRLCTADGVGAIRADFAEGTIDAAFRIHECIYRRLQGLQGTWAGLETDRVSAERATRGTARDATQLVVRII